MGLESEIEFIEDTPVWDVYVDGIAYVEMLAGENVRTAYFVHQRNRETGQRELIIRAKIVRPRTSILPVNRISNLINRLPVPPDVDPQGH